MLSRTAPPRVDPPPLPRRPRAALGRGARRAARRAARCAPTPPAPTPTATTSSSPSTAATSCTTAASPASPTTASGSPGCSRCAARSSACSSGPCARTSRPATAPSTCAMRELDALLVEPVEGAGPSWHLRRDGELWQLREYVAHRSLYHLKEADPQAWVIARLDGPAKAALVTVEHDEYGAGDPDRMHARLFADMMDALGLSTAYGHYLDAAPAATLAEVNFMSLCGLHRRLRGALVGQFATVELTSSPGSERLVRAMRRLGCPEQAVAFYDEHVEADAVHEQIIRHGVIAPLLAAEPAAGRRRRVRHPRQRLARRPVRRPVARRLDARPVEPARPAARRPGTRGEHAMTECGRVARDRPVAIVTGASRGLGFLLARELADRGHDLVDQRPLGVRARRRRRGAAGAGRRGRRPCPATSPIPRWASSSSTPPPSGSAGWTCWSPTPASIQVGPAFAMRASDFANAMDVMFYGVLHPVLAALPGDEAARRRADPRDQLDRREAARAAPAALRRGQARRGRVRRGVARRGDPARDHGDVRGPRPDADGLAAQRPVHRRPGRRAPLVHPRRQPPAGVDGRRARRTPARRGGAQGQAGGGADPLAKIGMRVHGVAPSTTIRLVALVNRLLPADETPRPMRPGHAVEKPARWFDTLTGLTRRAARRYHQHDDTTPGSRAPTPPRRPAPDADHAGGSSSRSDNHPPRSGDGGRVPTIDR